MCQKQAKDPTHAIATEIDSRTVTLQTDHTPQDRIAVRFEWALPFGELLKNQKNKMAMGSICQIMDKAQVFKKGYDLDIREIPDVTDGCADKS